MQHMLLTLCLPLSQAFLLAPGARLPAAAHPRAATSLSLRDDLRNAGVAALAAAVLVASPMAAEAKGGGHGGGGGGGGGHSSYSSSRDSSRRQLRSTVTPRRSSSFRRSSVREHRPRLPTYSSWQSTPPAALLYIDESTARLENGYFCPANLPKPGEKVDVDNQRATVVSSAGFESNCLVEVAYKDGTTATVSAAEVPASRLEQASPFLAAGAYVGLMQLTLGGVGAPSASPRSYSRRDRAKEQYKELVSDLKSSKAILSPMPLSGDYSGSSEESDEGDQAVGTHLKFGRDGTVRGHGKDGVDGGYRITGGRWGALDGNKHMIKVAWMERYDEGFTVAVEGEYRVKDGKINGRFTSTRGISGGFTLTPKLKPGVF